MSSPPSLQIGSLAKGWTYGVRSGSGSAVAPASRGKGLFFADVLSAIQRRLIGEGGQQARPLSLVDYRSRPVPACFYPIAENPRPADEKRADPTSAPTPDDPSDPAATGGCAAMPPCSPVQEVPAVFARAQGHRQIIDDTVRRVARKYRLPESLISGVIRAESSFRVDAVSPAGARGLMQLMPATARELGVEDPFDIEQNIDGGARYLRRMLDTFGGDTRLALAAYNAGPGTVRRYNGDVPYRETRNYVERVLRYAGETA